MEDRGRIYEMRWEDTLPRDTNSVLWLYNDALVAAFVLMRRKRKAKVEREIPDSKNDLVVIC